MKTRTKDRTGKTSIEPAASRRRRPDDGGGGLLGGVIDAAEDLVEDVPDTSQTGPAPVVTVGPDPGGALLPSLRDAIFAVDDSNPVTFSEALYRSVWPPFDRNGNVSRTVSPPFDEIGPASVGSFIRRYSPAGTKLQALASGGSSHTKWTFINRVELVPQLRERIHNPGIIDQNPTHLCGPLSVVVEFARRSPDEYVRAVTELLETGRWRTPGGMVVHAEDELREEAVPMIPEADWILAASMRDDANHWEDVDNGRGVEAMTFWGAMGEWTQHVLNLGYFWETCFHTGELDLIRRAQRAIDRGGVAFLLIDSDLIDVHDDGNAGETEEDMWLRAAWHLRRRDVRPENYRPVIDFPDQRTHCRDDNWPPDHWVVFLGGLQMPGGDDGPITLRLWSWRRQWEITGSADSFSEYLYAVVTGEP